jgi:hypothetical protein
VSGGGGRSKRLGPENPQHAVFDMGSERTTIRTEQHDLQVGREYEAQLRVERRSGRIEQIGAA